ncbi:MAG: septum formation initiator family protein [Pseudomonadota bacterium]
MWRRRITLRTVFFLYLLLLAVLSLRGERGLLKSYHLWREGKNLNAEISQLSRDTQLLRSQVRLYRYDPKTIERHARQELHLAGDREIQYIFR